MLDTNKPTAVQHPVLFCLVFSCLQQIHINIKRFCIQIRNIHVYGTGWFCLDSTTDTNTIVIGCECHNQGRNQVDHIDYLNTGVGYFHRRQHPVLFCPLFNEVSVSHVIVGEVILNWQKQICGSHRFEIHGLKLYRAILGFLQALKIHKDPIFLNCKISLLKYIYISRNCSVLYEN